MSLQLSDEPLQVLSGLQDAIKTLKCNTHSRVYFDALHEQLSELQPQLSSSIESMKEEAAYGQTLKQSQLKGLQVSRQQPCGMATVVRHHTMLLSSYTQCSRYIILHPYAVTMLPCPALPSLACFLK